MEFKNQHNHREAIASTFLHMFKNQSNCDVSLVVDGRMMKAHKRILSIFSTFFRDIFEEQEAISTIGSNLGANVAFLNYKYDHVEALIKYMYTGIIRVNKDEWPAVLKCAQDLGITTILEYSISLEKAEASAESKRKLDQQQRDSRSIGADAKRSKVENTKEALCPIEQRKSKELSFVASKDKSIDTSNDISGISFDHSNAKGDTTQVIDTSSAKTQLTKIHKVPRISDVIKDFTKELKSNDSSKKNVNSSSQPIQQIIPPTYSSTPIVKSGDNGGRSGNTIRSHSTDSDDSLEDFSLSKRTKKFGDKVKSLDAGLVANESRDKKAENILKQEPSRKETVPVPKPNPVNTTKKCSKCGTSYTTLHLIKSELPTPPAMCPVSGCDKVMKMNRMLMDHLSKFHKVTFCEEK